jgi:hypothetical protein
MLIEDVDVWCANDQTEIYIKTCNKKKKKTYWNRAGRGSDGLRNYLSNVKVLRTYALL